MDNRNTSWRVLLGMKRMKASCVRDVSQRAGTKVAGYSTAHTQITFTVPEADRKNTGARRLCGCFSKLWTSQNSRTLQTSTVYFSRVSYLSECNANDTYLLRMTHAEPNTSGECLEKQISNTVRA